MKLTKTQIDIVEHRLEIPDAMWDACEAQVIEMGFNEKVFDAAIKNVSNIIRTNFELMDLTNVEYIVLEDAVLGSTYVDMAFDDIGFDMSTQKAYAIERSYDDLLEKLELNG